MMLYLSVQILPVFSIAALNGASKEPTLLAIIMKNVRVIKKITKINKRIKSTELKF